MLVFFDLLLRLLKTFGVLTKLRANAQDFSVIWGNNGNCGQHSFHQWLRDGTWCTSINLVKVEDAGHAYDKMARVLNANTDAQAEALVTRDERVLQQSHGIHTEQVVPRIARRLDVAVRVQNFAVWLAADD